MTDKFGSPSLEDPTSEWEGLIAEIVAEGQDMVDSLGPTLMNRPPGSTPVPKEAQHQDWEATLADPNALMARLQAFTQVGFGPGLLAALKWDEEHRRMAGKMVNSGTT